MSSYSVGFDIFAKDRASDVFDHVGKKADGAGKDVEKAGQKVQQ